jgi:putative FmdB family regulatory protein
MPLYEYACQKCGERIEIIQRMNDPPSSICPTCGGELRKLFSSPAIQFKGSGFHKTDYATSSQKSDRESGESKSGESKSESKSSESKSSESKSSESKSNDSKSRESKSSE